LLKKAAEAAFFSATILQAIGGGHILCLARAGISPWTNADNRPSHSLEVAQYAYFKVFFSLAAMG
jgi:hypothetical protein